MTKKIIIFLILSFMVFSCGKKGDPVYKDSKSKSTTVNGFLNKA